MSESNTQSMKDVIDDIKRAMLTEQAQPTQSDGGEKTSALASIDQAINEAQEKTSKTPQQTPIISTENTEDEDDDEISLGEDDELLLEEESSTPETPDEIKGKSELNTPKEPIKSTPGQQANKQQPQSIKPPVTSKAPIKEQEPQPAQSKSAVTSKAPTQEPEPQQTPSKPSVQKQTQQPAAATTTTPATSPGKPTSPSKPETLDSTKKTTNAGEFISEESKTLTSKVLRDLFSELEKYKESVLPKRITVEELVIEMLRPELTRWLDKNLPGIVREVVKNAVQEIIDNLR